MFYALNESHLWLADTHDLQVLLSWGILQFKSEVSIWTFSVELNKLFLWCAQKCNLRYDHIFHTTIYIMYRTEVKSSVLSRSRPTVEWHFDLNCSYNIDTTWCFTAGLRRGQIQCQVWFLLDNTQCIAAAHYPSEQWLRREVLKLWLTSVYKWKHLKSVASMQLDAVKLNTYWGKNAKWLG